MAKGKRFYIISICLMVIVLITFFTFNIYGERQMKGLMGDRTKKVTKLEFVTDNGNRRIVVTDKKAIKTFLKKLNKMVVKKCFSQPDLVVVSKPVKLYIGDKLYKEIDLCDSCNFIDVSCVRYQIIRGSISSFDLSSFERIFGFTI